MFFFVIVPVQWHSYDQYMCFFSTQIVKEYERAIIFRLGRIVRGGAKGPGENLFHKLPFNLRSSPSLVFLSIFWLFKHGFSFWWYSPSLCNNMLIVLMFLSPDTFTLRILPQQVTSLAFETLDKQWINKWINKLVLADGECSCTCVISHETFGGKRALVKLRDDC